jgi:hypothetical protein
VTALTANFSDNHFNKFRSESRAVSAARRDLAREGVAAPAAPWIAVLGYRKPSGK